MQKHREFTTCDLNLAASLLALDSLRCHLDGPPRHRGFASANVAEQDIAAFYAGARVDARRLLGALRDLKGSFAQWGRL